MAKTYQPIPIERHWPKWKVEIAERLNEINMSMKKASIDAGFGETFVRDALKRDKEPTVSKLQKVRQVIGLDAIERPDMPVSGIEVVGKAQAGAFMDIGLVQDDPDNPTIDAPRNSKYPHARQYALQIVGDSMNKLFEDGSFVVCVNWEDTGLSYKPGMIVHVERHQGPLVEVTIKRLSKEDKGHFILEPVSSNPTHKPIRLDALDGKEIKIRGLVVSTFKDIFY